MFTLDHVVPWGRSFDEYRRMFSLTPSDLSGCILGCADGPASFNAEAARAGHRIISCDPIYRFSTDEIQARIAVTYDQVLDQARLNQHEFVWGNGIRDVEELGAVRLAAMQTFLEDYESGRSEGRYIDAALPVLPFADRAFDLALCSHLLFLYSVQLGESFHDVALRELCRVAAELRVFPLLSLGGEPSPFVDGSIRALRQAGFEVTVERVPYEFQRGGNEMLRIRRSPALTPT